MLWALLPVCLRSEGPTLVSMLGHSPPAACPWPPQQFWPSEHRCHVSWGNVLASRPCLSVGQTYFPRVNAKVSSAFVKSGPTPPGGLSRGPSSNCLRAVWELQALGLGASRAGISTLLISGCHSAWLVTGAQSMFGEWPGRLK